MAENVNITSASSVTDMGGSDDCLDPKFWKGDPYMDVEKWENPLPKQIKKAKKIVIDDTNKPDEFIFGEPCFIIEDDELCNFLTGRKVHWRWLKQTKNERLRNFAKKNPGISFFIKTKNGEYYKVYYPKSFKGSKMIERKFINVLKDGNKLIIEFKEREGFNAFMKGLKENKNFWMMHPHTKEMVEEIKSDVKHRYIFVKYGDFYTQIK